MLRDAHRIDDRGGTGLSVQPRGLDEFLRRHAGDLRRELGGIRLDGTPEVFQALRPLGDEGLVLEALGQDDPDERVYQGHVRAVPLLQVEVGQFREFNRPGVGDDESRFPEADGPLDRGPDDGMALGGVRPDDEDDVGLLEVRDGVRHGSAAERQREAHHGRSVTQPGTMVHVVCPHRRAHELLHQVVFFVCRLGAGEARHGIRAVPVADFAEPLGHERQRLVPRRGHETAVLPHERCPQALVVPDEVGPEPALHA